jgi:glycosyltransferase involved in cell wall biosynthesis
MSGSRRLVASSRRLEADERFDLLLHVLAQLPDDVTLQIWGDGPERSRLERLAEAYGITDRVAISPDPPDDGSRQVVYPSLSNAATAPLQSSDSITLDISGESTGARRGIILNTPAQLVSALSRDDDPPAPLRADPKLLAGQRIVVVTNQPAPYRIPLFERVAARVADAGAAFRVLFLARHAADRSWMRTDGELPFDHAYLPSVQLPLRRRPPAVPVALEREVGAFSPTMILAGGFSLFASVPLARYATRRAITFGLWSGEHGGMRTAQSRARQAERRWIANRASFAIAYGSRGAEYLRHLRPDLPVVYGRNTSTFAPAPARPAHDGHVEILTVGDLASPRKGIDVLLDAFARVPHLRCRLTVVGGGKLLGDLTARARHDSRIRFFGALPPRRVRDLYCEVDAFAFPSRADVFGLAPVEAMGTGLATVVSAAPGMVADLCVDGKNCLVVESDDPRAWAAALERLVSDSALRARLGADAARTIERRWTIDHAADAMVAGFRLGGLTMRASAAHARRVPAKQRTAAVTSREIGRAHV